MQEDKIKQLINLGYSQRQIADELRIGRTQVVKLLKEYNLKTTHKAKPKYEIEDLIGKTYGKLTIKEFSHKDSHGKYFRCVCSCGKETVVRLSQLTSNSALSCGCLRIDNNKENVKNMHKFRDENYNLNLSKTHIGEKFNRLLIIDTKRITGQVIKMICICDCGNVIEAIYGEIKNGKVKSCGCLNRETSSKIGSTVGINNYKNGYEWYFVFNNEKFKCRSGFEVIYANFLVQNSIKFEYEPQTFEVAKGRRYTPDFYILEEDLYVEIKGTYEISNQKEKAELFKKEHNLIVLFWEDLIKICNLNCKTYNTLINRAKRLNLRPEDYLANRCYLTT